MKRSIKGPMMKSLGPKVLTLYIQCILLVDQLFMLQIQHCSDKIFQIYIYLNYVCTICTVFLQNIYKKYDPNTGFIYSTDLSHAAKISYATIITPYNKYDISLSFKTYLILNKQDEQTLFSLKKFLLIYNSIITRDTPNILTIHYMYHHNIKSKVILLDKNAKVNIIKL